MTVNDADRDRALHIELRRGLLLMANAIADRYGLPRAEASSDSRHARTASRPASYAHTGATHEGKEYSVTY